MSKVRWSLQNVVLDRRNHLQVSISFSESLLKACWKNRSSPQLTKAVRCPTWETVGTARSSKDNTVVNDSRTPTQEKIIRIRRRPSNAENLNQIMELTMYIANDSNR